MTVQAFRSAAQLLDARSAPQGKYLARYNGRTVEVIGPERMYPSGIKYYRIAESEHFVPAAQIQWIKPLPRHRRARNVLVFTSSREQPSLAS
jgi:hypothetical protein